MFYRINSQYIVLLFLWILFFVYDINGSAKARENEVGDVMVTTGNEEEKVRKTKHITENNDSEDPLLELDENGYVREANDTEDEVPQEAEENKLNINKLGTVDKFSQLINWSKKMFNKLLKDFPDSEVVPPQAKSYQDKYDVYLAAENENPQKMTFMEFKGSSLYKDAMTILNSTNRSKAEGYSLLLEASEAGHTEAKLKVAWALLLGENLPQNIMKARDIFSELAHVGVADAHMGLGLLYASGLSVMSSPSKALIHYLVGAIGGSIWARMALGYRYWAGVSLIANCESSLMHYRLVANEVANEVQFSGGNIIQRIRLMDEMDNPRYSSGILDSDLFQYYQLLAEKGDVQAQVGLGQLHYQGGRGVKQDHEKALHYFLQAADAGNSLAIAFLGRIYLEGRAMIKVDAELAYKYFQKAADLGNAVGQSGLGIMYLKGIGVERNYGKALKYFSLSAEQGWVDGHLQLGIMYFNGLGVTRNFKMAYKYFTLASQSGHVLAFFNLAQMHANGIGILRSCSTAVELYKNVAERGKWGKMLMQARLLYHNMKYREAFVHYILLSELGYEVAQSNAAFMLDRGEMNMGLDRTQDYNHAIIYWGRAAMQSYSAAQVKLGDYHYYGLGTSIDYEQAAVYYRVASEQQNAQAMFNLAYMHEHGIGMAKDVHLAKRCYDMAAETNIDAEIPVALALVKLNIITSLKEFILLIWNGNFILSRLHLSQNWDIYLISLLIALLGICIFYRPTVLRITPN